MHCTKQSGDLKKFIYNWIIILSNNSGSNIPCVIFIIHKIYKYVELLFDCLHCYETLSFEKKVHKVSSEFRRWSYTTVDSYGNHYVIIGKWEGEHSRNIVCGRNVPPPPHQPPHPTGKKLDSRPGMNHSTISTWKPGIWLHLSPKYYPLLRQ